MKISPNFDLREFVSPQTWAKWGAKARWFVRPEVINGAELLREIARQKYPTAIVEINTYLYGRSYTHSGYREPLSYSEGQFNKTPNTESLHRQGAAIDCKIKTDSLKYLSSKEMAALVTANEDRFLSAGITRMEDWRNTKGSFIDWLHLDCANTGLDYILVVKP